MPVSYVQPAAKKCIWRQNLGRQGNENVNKIISFLATVIYIRKQRKNRIYFVLYKKINWRQ